MFQSNGAKQSGDHAYTFASVISFLSPGVLYYLLLMKLMFCLFTNAMHTHACVHTNARISRHKCFIPSTSRFVWFWLAVVKLGWMTDINVLFHHIWCICWFLLIIRVIQQRVQLDMYLNRHCPSSSKQMQFVCVRACVRACVRVCVCRESVCVCAEREKSY